MDNRKHYPLHPGQTQFAIFCQVPLEEYESLKAENERLRHDKKELVETIEKMRRQIIGMAHEKGIKKH